ncbi:molecular chaperone Hsp90 [Saccharomonospora piscinae]|uniref:sacsin N-terminal ATP-binding-like domain-containing protein n=1 Tax=Saccharomonospora piscinae TaxID=687388 RepID=UPI001105AEB4|nr:molecular chaperone Hsp90 [Saccharomonospora piscinae]TLW92400.1 molecular chaperone Hsp90 [Saccharomonospora piscinae]
MLSSGDLDELRQAVLRSWHDSPTRFTEDTQAERDLLRGAYRDRVFVELAQNAADAAALAGRPGRLRVSVVDGELRVANTGAPLDRRGVAALASLRASGKPPSGQGLVGRFGVGFAAVLAVTAEPRVVSRTGGVAFSERRTRQVWEAPEVPVLRLPWPLPEDEPPLPEGFDTEVRLPLRHDPGPLLEQVAAEVADVLLVLPWLAEVEVGQRRWTRRTEGGTADASDEVVLTLPGERRARWLTHRGEGCVWALPLADDGAPRPLPGDPGDVLHAPTPTDERLSLPARLLTTAVPLEPSRRRVLASAGTPEVTRALDAAAAAYPGLVRALPPRHRLALVPRPHFPLSDVDAVLRERVTRRLADAEWVPSAEGGSLPGRRARVLDLAAARLVELVAELVPDLAAAPLCGREAARTAAVAGARPLGVAELAEALTGVERPPSWWHAVYTELHAAVERSEVDPDELGALPVPLTDGRTVPGARGALLLDDAEGAVSAMSAVAELAIPGLHVVHPGAAHPLLHRLGARRAGPADLLAAPPVAAAVDRSVDDALAGLDVEPLAEAVLSWLSSAPGLPEPERAALGALALPSVHGPRRADELLLPDAAILPVLDPDAVGDDAPLDVLARDLAQRWNRDTLVRAGVRDTFPVGHATTDESEPAVADLDLVADDAWPAALRLLASEPATWRVLSAPDGRLRDWLAAHALLAGRSPGQWRLASARAAVGLFDPVPDVGLGDDLLVAAGVRTGVVGLAVRDADDAALVCARLGDPDRTVPPGVVLRAHGALSELPPDDVEPPARVRTLAGSVCDAADAVVLDAPWLLGVWPADRLVAAAEFADAAALADVLDLPLASDETTVGPDDDGEFAAWAELPAIVEVADLLGAELPDGGVLVHDELTVGGVVVPWWHDGEFGTAHASDSPDGLARAFAWEAGRWTERVVVERLLDDPGPRTVLG